MEEDVWHDVVWNTFPRGRRGRNGTAKKKKKEQRRGMGGEMGNNAGETKN